ncbi:hypothetical protein Dsin_005553 [Dipteronia sinensis]|uniref:Ubiquitin-like protease family profile domain-containing protein n=1 Tax=Dipteronia sinensis TaxID=43782 RepID=A0AAE0AWS4_9ROSI|nr:hypothetical protein Dsin_005553 [Dipteronia sinensis]
MLVDHNKKLWRYPDHKEWIHARINSQNKKYFIRDLKSVLTRCGMADGFRQGPFGQYLDMVQPVKARFGRQEFCLCSGLNMGTLREGFQQKKKVRDDSILTRYFEDKRPTIELLEATFRGLTATEDDVALKMGYLLMVSQFFGIDEARAAIPENEEKNKKKQKKKNKKNKKKKKEEKEEKKKKKKTKKKKKKKTEVRDGEDREEETDNDNQQADNNKDNEQKNDYFTFNIYGFQIAFQVWAIQRITRLEGRVGRRIGTGFPIFKNWDFHTGVVKVETQFSTTMPLFPWKVYDHEKSSDYYKSMKVEDLTSGRKASKKKIKLGDPVMESDEEDHGEAMEEVAASLMRSRSRNLDQPLSRKQLFHRGDCETPKSKLQTSVPSTIPNMYSAIAQLIKQSEEHTRAFCTAEFAKFRKELKVGDTPVEKSTFGKERARQDKVVDDLDSRCKDISLPVQKCDDMFFENFDVDVDVDGDKEVGLEKVVGEKFDVDCDKEVGLENVDSETAVLEKVDGDGDKAVFEKVDGEKFDFDGDSVALQKVDGEKLDGDTCGFEKVDGCLDEFEKFDRDTTGLEKVERCSEKVVIEAYVLDNKNGKNVQLCIEKIPVQQPISVDDYPSPAMNIVLPNPVLSVMCLDASDPNVFYKNNEKRRGRKRSRFLESSYTDPIPKKKKNTLDSGEVINEDYIRVYTGKMMDMKREDFNELLNPEKWFSNLLSRRSVEEAFEGRGWLLSGYRIGPDSLFYDDTIEYVCGSELIYNEPCWTLESHSNYYEQLKIPPHTTPFTGENALLVNLPQQDDGNSCGAFMLKFAELLLSREPLPWNDVFGQKDIPVIRNTIALDIFSNGEMSFPPDQL